MTMRRGGGRGALWGGLSGRALGAAAGSLALAGALLAWPAPVTESVRASVLYCLTGLAPSLFPFLALTSFVVRSPAGEALGRPLGWLARYVFRLPACCAAPVLLGFVGGYPAGARGASLLLGQGKITREQAGRMMLFCVNPGAAFVVTYLGGEVLHSLQAGWLLFFSVTLAGLALGALVSLGAPLPPKEPAVPAPGATAQGGALVAAVADASSGVLRMCACIVLFAGFSAVLRASGLYGLAVRGLAATGLFSPGEAGALVSSLLEVTGGLGEAADFQVGPGFFAFGLAFGGLCVHLQVVSLFRDFPAPLGRFLLFRLFHGLLAAALPLFLGRLMPLPPGSQAVLAQAGSAGAARVGLSGTWAGGLSLLLLCAAFLLITGREGEKGDCAGGRDVLQ